MTIKEAFEKYKEIEIDYVFINECSECKKIFETVDEEYSFDGDIEYFIGDWQQEYGVMDLDDEITEIGVAHYRIERDITYNRDVCPECEDEC